MTSIFYFKFFETRWSVWLFYRWIIDHQISNYVYHKLSDFLLEIYIECIAITNRITKNCESIHAKSNARFSAWFWTTGVEKSEKMVMI